MSKFICSLLMIIQEAKLYKPNISHNSASSVQHCAKPKLIFWQNPQISKYRCWGMCIKWQMRNMRECCRHRNIKSGGLNIYLDVIFTERVEEDTFKTLRTLRIIFFFFLNLIISYILWGTIILKAHSRTSSCLIGKQTSKYRLCIIPDKV